MNLALGGSEKLASAELQSKALQPPWLLWQFSLFSNIQIIDARPSSDNFNLKIIMIEPAITSLRPRRRWRHFVFFRARLKSRDKPHGPAARRLI